jgi:glutaredoxin
MAAEVQGLSIYGYPQCPYCQRVLRAADSLGMQIELRNTAQSAEFQRELAAATGRMTVPVLRIEEPGGDVRWLPESEDIVDYLQDLATGSG